MIDRLIGWANRLIGVKRSASTEAVVPMGGPETLGADDARVVRLRLRLDILRRKLAYAMANGLPVADLEMRCAKLGDKLERAKAIVNGN